MNCLSFVPSQFLTLAQAPAPAAELETSTGQAIGGMLLLLTVGCSIWMTFVWTNRRRVTGHYLPAAERGVLRVPFSLTAVGILFAILMLLMLTLNSLIDPKTLTAAAKASASADTAEASKEANTPPAPSQSATLDSSSSALTEAQPSAPSAAADDKSKSDPAVNGDVASTEQPTARDPKKMRQMMWLNIEFELFVFGLFGLFVLLARSQGRASIDEPAADQIGDGSLTTVMPAEVSGAVDDTTSPPSIYIEPEEPFSLAREVRFAGEVFLAAYLPTTMLRAFIVSLYTSIVGEDPGQHELLEMLKSGVDSTLMLMIGVTAVVLAPIVEELQFRVVILGGLAQKGQAKAAMFISSILFGLVHGLPDGLALLPLAFALGYTYLQRRSYITVILVHFFFNAFNMLLALLMLM